MSSKRSYTVPVLLVIITVLTTMIVMVYSKLLIAQQTDTTDAGTRLAEQYTGAIVFAERTSEGTGLLLKDASQADRLRGKRLLGEASFPGFQAAGVLSEAVHRSSGQVREAAAEPISAAMTEVNGKLSGVAEHEGPLTAEEKRVLETVRDGSARMAEALHRFRPPSGEAGYRQMEAGGDWVAAAADAAKALEDMASKLKPAK